MRYIINACVAAALLVGNALGVIGSKLAHLGRPVIILIEILSLIAAAIHTTHVSVVIQMGA